MILACSQQQPIGLYFMGKRYLDPENVEAWRRRAIAVLDEQFANDGDEGIVLSFIEDAKLARTQA